VLCQLGLSAGSSDRAGQASEIGWGGFGKGARSRVERKSPLIAGLTSCADVDDWRGTSRIDAVARSTRLWRRVRGCGGEYAAVAASTRRWRRVRGGGGEYAAVAASLRRWRRVRGDGGEFAARSSSRRGDVRSEATFAARRCSQRGDVHSEAMFTARRCSQRDDVRSEAMFTVRRVRDGRVRDRASS
jgi:hypothetical protein